MTDLGRNLERVLRELDLTSTIPLPSDDSIPLEPEKFYADFGYLQHPETRQPVKQLAPYQVDVWKSMQQNKRTLVVKSNKIGLSTSILLADLQLAVLPSVNPLSTRGYDTLVIAQTVAHAQEHLKTLKKLLLNSPKYQGFLITKPEDEGFREEATKVNQLFLKNPEHPEQPSRIIALGLNNAGAIASWKNVKHIHVSDATAAEGDITEAMSYADTRLANTNGTMIVETIPSPPEGYIFDLYQANNGKEGARWKVFTIPATEAVKAGVIKQEFLDAERLSKGVLYGRYYGAQFVSGDGNIFDYRLLDLCTQDYPLQMGDGRKVLAVDPAFGKSKFGILGAERIGDKIFIRVARQFERPSPAVMIDIITRLFHEGKYSICLVDGSQTGTITDLSERIRTEKVNFGEKLSEMTWSAIRVVNEQKVVIHSTFTELLNQLKMATFNDKGHPDKTKGNSLDILDCFIMAMDELAGGRSGVGAAYAPPDDWGQNYGDEPISTGCAIYIPPD